MEQEQDEKEEAKKKKENKKRRKIEKEENNEKKKDLEEANAKDDSFNQTHWGIRWPDLNKCHSLTAHCNVAHML